MRKGKSRNIFFYDDLESQSNDLGAHINHDESKLIEILQELGTPEAKFTEILQNPSKDKTKPKPLKVCFIDKVTAVSILKKLSTFRNHIKFQGDFMNIQKEGFKKIKSEVEKAENKGKKTIKFLYGISHIVDITQKKKPNISNQKTKQKH